MRNSFPLQFKNEIELFSVLMRVDADRVLYTLICMLCLCNGFVSTTCQIRGAKLDGQ